MNTHIFNLTLDYIQHSATGQKAFLTCRHNDSPLIGGHVGRRGILLIHVVSIVHLRCVVTPYQLIAFTNTAVHWRLPAKQTHARTHTKILSADKLGVVGFSFPVIDFGMRYLSATLARAKYIEDYMQKVRVSCGKEMAC